VLVTFDPAKEIKNIRRHGVSLTMANRFDWRRELIQAAKFVGGEQRLKILATAGNRVYAGIFIVRNGRPHMISLRPASPRNGESMQRGKPDRENPEWTDEDVRTARRGADVLPAAFLRESDAATAARKGRGPGKRPPRTMVSIRLEQELIAAYKASGPGWQGRMRDVLAGERNAPKMKPTRTVKTAR
jgi:uncharacterized protein (DUF4415 family)